MAKICVITCDSKFKIFGLRTGAVGNFYCIMNQLVNHKCMEKCDSLEWLFLYYTSGSFCCCHFTAKLF